MYLSELLRIIEELKEFKIENSKFKKAVNLLVEVVNDELEKIKFKLNQESKPKPKLETKPEPKQPLSRSALKVAKKLVENEEQYKLAAHPEDLRRMLKCHRKTFEQIRPYIKFPFDISELKALLNQARE